MSTALALVALVALAPANAAALEITPVYTISAHTFASEDSFGTAIAAVPPYVLVGTPMAEDGEDTADLVDFVTGAHVRTFVDPAPLDQSFGSSVALVGPFAIVGQPGRGEVHVFDVATGALLRTIGNPVPDLASGFGARLAALPSEVFVGTDADVVVRIDPFSGGVERIYTNPVPGLTGRGGPIAVMPPDDPVAVMQAADGTLVVHLFHGSTGTRLRTFVDPTGGASQFGVALAVVDGDVFVGAPGDGAGAVHHFDGATTLLRRTLRNPSGVAGEQFGAGIAGIDGRVAVGAPVAADPDYPDYTDNSPGRAWFFDVASGAVLGELGNPFSPDYFALFGAPLVASAGRVLVGAVGGLGVDNGHVSAYRLGCGNAALEPGEACDDGNAIEGDGCDSNCTATACGNGAVSPGEECDDGDLDPENGCTATCTVAACGDGVRHRNHEVCDDGNRADLDGCDANCRPSLCVGGVPIERARVMLRRPGGATPGRAIVRGALPPHIAEGWDPERDGFAVQVVDDQDPYAFGLNGVLGFAGVQPFQTPLPAGAPGSHCGPQDGWRADTARRRFVYRNTSQQWLVPLAAEEPPVCLLAPGRGLVEAVVRRRRDGSVRFVVDVRDVYFGDPPLPLHGSVALGATPDAGIAGTCGGRIFPPGSCTRRGGDRTIDCR